VSHSDQCKLHSNTLPRSCTQYSSFPNNVLLCLLKSGPAKFLVNMSAGLSHPGNQTVLIIAPSFDECDRHNSNCLQGQQLPYCQYEKSWASSPSIQCPQVASFHRAYLEHKLHLTLIQICVWMEGFLYW
jgi:hypothetical protein